MAGSPRLMRLVPVALMAVAAVWAWGDVVELRSGERITGKVLSQTDERIVVRVRGERRTIPIASVQRIKSDPRQVRSELRKRVAAARTDKELVALARWCLVHGLPDEALVLVERAKRKNPFSEEADTVLGEVNAALGRLGPGRMPPTGNGPNPFDKDTRGSTDGPSAAQLRQRVVDLAGKGDLTDQLVEMFFRYAAADACQNSAPVVPAEFWAWLEGQPLIRDGLLAGTYPPFDPAVLRSLQALRRGFGREVERFPHLSLAFALVYGLSGHGTLLEKLSGQGSDWGRAVPTMRDSFGWYLANESKMKMSPRTTPWPLLVYVADNDVSIKERRWAVETYGKNPAASIGHVYYKVRYDCQKLRDKPTLGRRPWRVATRATSRRWPAVTSVVWCRAKRARSY